MDTTGSKTRCHRIPRTGIRLKVDKAEVPYMYLGASIQKVETADGAECLIMSEEKYVKASVENVEPKIAKSNCRLPSRCYTPMATTYHPNEDVK